MIRMLAVTAMTAGALALGAGAASADPLLDVGFSIDTKTINLNAGFFDDDVSAHLDLP
ncbi:hypothetical protein Lesp02_76480 [Lentzea sp. NBRC 105346]|uniref:hypothetical protein n=1 Tax=Lentzea sp. NBRC 105346 TaxID=3032205 RepID=UPI00249F996B|nr:hypothetical protein [Lentzea sp. NBRC 105346]GLZ35461.1 hypothetical protein Lesp02_76480 [Lentzea sp. NBRC 105346]